MCFTNYSGARDYQQPGHQGGDEVSTGVPSHQDRRHAALLQRRSYHRPFQRAHLPLPPGTTQFAGVKRTLQAHVAGYSFGFNY